MGVTRRGVNTDPVNESLAWSGWRSQRYPVRSLRNTAAPDTCSTGENKTRGRVTDDRDDVDFVNEAAGERTVSILVPPPTGEGGRTREGSPCRTCTAYLSDVVSSAEGGGWWWQGGSRWGMMLAGG